MNNYIRGRIRADIAHAIELSSQQADIPHFGMRGRFRELLTTNVIEKWLPSSARCGTGMIIDVNNRERRSTQEDIVIYDSSLMPSVMITSNQDEGVFPLNAVLARIEVKSVLNKTELRGAIEAAAEIKCMEFAANRNLTWPLPTSLIFAFSSDLAPGGDPYQEWYRMMEVNRELNMPFPGPITGLCVIGRGCWLWGGVREDGNPSWISAKMDPVTNPLEEALLFVGAVSNTCYEMKALRQGLDPVVSVQGGIGNFILSSSTNERFSHGESVTVGPAVVTTQAAAGL